MVDGFAVEAADSEGVEALPAALGAVRQVVPYTGTDHNPRHPRPHCSGHCELAGVQVALVADHEARPLTGDQGPGAVVEEVLHEVLLEAVVADRVVLSVSEQTRARQ